MPQYYGGTQGPAQYAMHQQSRQDQQMSQLLRMFMMMKQSKQQQGQWEKERDTQQQQWGQEQQRKEKSTDAYVEELERQATEKPKPTLTDLRTRTAEDMVKRREWTPDEGQRYIEQGKEPVRLPKNVDVEFSSHMKTKYGDDWKNTVESVQFYEEWDDFRKEKQAKSTPKDSLGEIRKYYSRQRNEIKQRYIPIIASADPDEKDVAKKALADALNASKDAEQEEIDLFKGVKKKEAPPPPEPPKFPDVFPKGKYGQPQSQWSGVKAMREGNNVIINNKPYPMNADGTVTVNGRKFKID